MIGRILRAMPVPTMPQGGLGGAFGIVGTIVGPLMMLAIALQKPGPVRTLIKAGADAPDRARKPATLGVSEPHLQPLIRAGVVVREADGRVWLDRARARRRQWRIGAIVGGAIVVAGLLVAAVLAL